MSEAIRNAGNNGFTLLDLLAVIAVIAVLIVLELPALAAGKSQSKIAICASHIRQLVTASQIFANDNNNQLPTLGGGAWAWDTPNATAYALLNGGAQTNTFYCPGTSPRFTDAQNWAGPGTTLWNFSVTHHIIGYVPAFSGSHILAATNQTPASFPKPSTIFPALE